MAAAPGFHIEAEAVPEAEDAEQSSFGGAIVVTFELDGGRQETLTFQEGHTIDWMKSQLDRQFGVPFEETSLFYNDKMMPDPLSLVDLGITAGMADVRIVARKTA